MVGIHAGLVGERLPAEEAFAVLLFQERAENAPAVLLHRLRLIGALLKIRLVFRVERVGRGADFDVAADEDAVELNQSLFIAVVVFCAEYPVAIGVVVLHHPDLCFVVGMPPVDPLPGHFPDLVVNVVEGFGGHNVAVIQPPSAQDGVEFVYQVNGFGRAVAAYGAFYLAQEGLHTPLGGFDEEFALVFAHVLAEEVKPPVNVCQVRFLLREREAAPGQETADGRFDLCFQHVGVVGGDDEIVGVAHEIHLHGVDVAVSVVADAAHAVDVVFQTVQHHIGQRRGDDAALRRSRFGGKQPFVPFDVPAFEPFLQGAFRHSGDIL